ncbi:MAG: DUF222 domain-containing protein [Actinomycetota bacterium]
MEFASRSERDGALVEADQAFKAFCAASARMLKAVAGLDRAGDWPEDQELSLETFLSWRYGTGHARAFELVRMARSLDVLPDIARAHEEGRISAEQLRPLTRFASPENDSYWGSHAGETKLRRLYELARRKEAADRDDREPERRGRGLRMQWNDAKTDLQIEGSLPGAKGASFEAAIRRCASQIDVEDDVWDREAAKQADAVVELVTSPGGRHAPPTLVLHADAEVLTGSERVASGSDLVSETDTGVQLTSEEVRRLACDSHVEWIVETSGRPIGIGRASRLLPPRYRRLLEFRDRTCRFAGCERTRYLKIHHLDHWATGGRTDLRNLILVCQRHHRALHEGGWRTSGSAESELRFHGPPGNRFTMRSTIEPLKTSA